MLDIANPNTIEKMRKLMLAVQQGDWVEAEAESTEFWHEACHILGDEIETYGQSLGMGRYSSCSAKSSEHEIMQEVMSILKFEHHKATS